MAAMRVHLVAGARPNVMKVAPLYHQLVREDWCEPIIVHTGQHTDPAMSSEIFDALGLPAPHVTLDADRGSHARQTGSILVAYESLLVAEAPAATVVVGDVDSTLACALAAAKLHVPVAHLEAGLRSNDLSMPEEINRRLTDAISDRLWTPSQDADAALRRENIPADRIELVGNIMIDAIELVRADVERDRTLEELGIAGAPYVVATIHRPATVDDEGMLATAIGALAALAMRVPVVLPVHPRTARRLAESGLDASLATTAIRVTGALGYVSFLALLSGAALVITDSGGVQEETTYLGVPCATMRPVTERPVTISDGTNRLAAWADLPRLLDDALTDGAWPSLGPPPLWDGAAAVRIAGSMRRWLVD